MKTQLKRTLMNISNQTIKYGEIINECKDDDLTDKLIANQLKFIEALEDLEVIILQEVGR